MIICYASFPYPSIVILARFWVSWSIILRCYIIRYISTRPPDFPPTTLDPLEWCPSIYLGSADSCIIFHWTIYLSILISLCVTNIITFGRFRFFVWSYLNFTNGICFICNRRFSLLYIFVTRSAFRYFIFSFYIYFLPLSFVTGSSRYRTKIRHPINTRKK